jgi:hypothetical protein
MRERARSLGRSRREANSGGAGKVSVVLTTWGLGPLPVPRDEFQWNRREEELLDPPARRVLPESRLR